MPNDVKHPYIQQFLWQYCHAQFYVRFGKEWFESWELSPSLITLFWFYIFTIWQINEYPCFGPSLPNMSLPKLPLWNVAYVCLAKGCPGFQEKSGTRSPFSHIQTFASSFNLAPVQYQLAQLFSATQDSARMNLTWRKAGDCQRLYWKRVFNLYDQDISK